MSERHANTNAGGNSAKRPVKPIQAVLIVLLAALVAGFVGIEVWKGTFEGSGPADTPEPWHYDAANNRHWHPGHGHWHDGPPPASEAGAASEAAPGTAPGTASDMPLGTGPAPPSPQFGQAGETGETPEPWEYDEANNRHWHPGHGHWHGGPPPPPAARD